MATLQGHRKFDYAAGSLTVITPYLFGFSHILDARNVFIVVGIAMILYSLFTQYNHSRLKFIPFPLHRIADLLAAGMIMTAPSTFGYKGQIHAWQEGIHYLIGVAILSMVAFTRRSEERPWQSVTVSPAPQPTGRPGPMAGGWIPDKPLDSDEIEVETEKEKKKIA